MQVNRVVIGDIINMVINLKNRPCVVINIDNITKTAIVVPLTTEKPEKSQYKVEDAPGLLHNRFLKERSYFVYSISTIPLETARKKFAGTVKKETCKYIRDKVTYYLNQKLKK